MNRFLRTYKPFARAGVLEAVSYRTNFIFVMIGNVLGCFIMFFLWNAIFISSNEPTFKGFSQTNMVLYIFISFFTTSLTGSGGTWDVGEEIKDGSIAMRILKPVSFNMTYLFQEIGNKFINVCIVFIPILVGIEIYKFCVAGSLQFNIGYFVLYLVSIIFAYLINFHFNICYGFTAFVFKNLWGSNMLKNCIVGFLSGATIPLAFFPSTMQKVLEFLPFASLSYTPIMIYMGMYGRNQIILYLIIQIFWLLFFVMLSKFIWKIVIKRLCVQGG